MSDSTDTETELPITDPPLAEYLMEVLENDAPDVLSIMPYIELVASSPFGDVGGMAGGNQQSVSGKQQPIAAPEQQQPLLDCDKASYQQLRTMTVLGRPEYVLPHTPPTLRPPPPPPPPPPVFTGPVTPTGDRFVESVVKNALPALEPWPGRLQFEATVRAPTGPAPHGRQQPYVFCTETNKLYVDAMIAVPFAFRVADDAYVERLSVSALPVYPEMHHVNTPVRRCPTHREAGHESNASIGTHVNHVIRAEHQGVKYLSSGNTNERRSVVVPYQRPQPGADEYKVLYKFCCMNTCVGGINRRRLVVLFVLEDTLTGEALGRQVVEVKVCKCPHRDYRTDLQRRRRLLSGSESAAPPPQPPPPPPAPFQLRPLKKRRVEVPPSRQPRTGQLVVPVDDIDMYDHLIAVRDSLRQYRARAMARAPCSPAADDGDEDSSGEAHPPAPAADDGDENSSGEAHSPARAAVTAPDPRLCRLPTLPIKEEL